jgi:hypothetical protein
MKTILLLTVILPLLGLHALAAAAPPAEPAQKPAPKPAQKPAVGKLQHVVAFKFNEEASPAQIRQVEEAFAGLRKKIREIHAFEWGTNVSPEQLDKGFTHCFILTFRTEKDRDIYLEHPEHKKFVDLVGPVVADVFVIDFWAR